MIKSSDYFSSYKIQLLKYNLKKLGFEDLAVSINSIKDNYVMNLINNDILNEINKINQDYNLFREDGTFRYLDPETKKFTKRFKSNKYNVKINKKEEEIIKLMRENINPFEIFVFDKNEIRLQVKEIRFSDKTIKIILNIET